ncbi:Six-bladed beta-propeller [Heracleum sosnowskyi]|uniref:Six-bladed beta-propeller n=1 Tax=Heracleum sosnowskyi TaxID=360622 RepID=A0AAD8GMV6_9APIA|nr:Six-bladed beta-propeller [Heracleum sosnowskyi]
MAALQLRRFRQLSRCFPSYFPGFFYGPSRRNNGVQALHYSFPSVLCPHSDDSAKENYIYSQRFSTVSRKKHKSLDRDGLLSFIASSLDKVEGPSHYWLNKSEDNKAIPRRDGVFLVLAGAFLKELKSESVIMIENVKALQQRYPAVHVMGFQSNKSIFSDDFMVQLLQSMMREFITFPILLSTNNFPEVLEGACYILFEGFKCPQIFYEKDVDIGIIDKAIKKLNMQEHNNKSVNKLESSWAKPTPVIPEPYFGSSLQNLFLYFPGCIAVDESNDRLFISDSNHHRIIVSDGSGEILESIGASPGFEDGEFQWAKLNRPAASFYHTADDCLYFVDSENHAIRRADMERRVVETLYPMCNINNKRYSLWSWILDKIWPSNDPVAKSGTHDSETILYPWHMMKSVDDLYILTRSFETLWIMDLASGDIKDVVKVLEGFSKIWEICGQMILEKSALLKNMPSEWLQQQVGPDCALEGVQYASLMSSVATYQDHVVVCDAVGQRLLKLNKTSGSVASFQCSNFGILGLPYWCLYSLERVYAIDAQTSRSDHIQQFSLLPGRIDIQLIVDIPEDTVLVEPLREDYVWWQARGTATVVPEAKKKEESLEKVGVAQQWYNELDDLAALTPKEKLSTEKEEMISDSEVQEGRICIKSAINTSPGTCEVIISAAIYLKLKNLSTSTDDNREKYASRIAHHLSNKSGRSRRDQCLQQLLASNADVRDLIFMKPLNVKLLFECLNHPKAKNSKDIILTNSSVDVNVSLT